MALVISGRCVHCSLTIPTLVLSSCLNFFWEEILFFESRPLFSIREVFRIQKKQIGNHNNYTPLLNSCGKTEVIQATLKDHLRIFHFTSNNLINGRKEIYDRQSNSPPTHTHINTRHMERDLDYHKAIFKQPLPISYKISRQLYSDGPKRKLLLISHLYVSTALR